MLYVGLDVHLRHVTLCVLSEVVERRTVRGYYTGVVEALRQLPQPLAVCYEASCGYGALYDRLAPLARRVVVAHPGQLRLIFRSKRKNDRVDAEKLAKLLYLNEVPAAYVPSAEVRAWRELIEYRRRLIQKRTRVKNSLRAILRAAGAEAPRGEALWSGKGRRWLAGLALPTSLRPLSRDLALDELELLDRQIARAERELDRFSEQSPAVALLRTIPGVGPRTAEAVAAAIDDPDRFRSSKSIGCHFGLVPTQDQSGPSNRLGHITRQGPASARQLLAEASWQALRYSPTVRAYFERVRRGDDDRKKIALVATAHYLARVMLAMLKQNKPWREAAA